MIVWRVLYAGIGGYPTASWFEYITFKTSDPGDVPSFCIPLTLMLFDLKHKLATREGFYEKVCDSRTCKLVLTDLGIFAVYSCLWWYFYTKSRDVTYSATATNYCAGIVIAIFVIPFTVIGMQIRNQENSQNDVTTKLIVCLNVMAIAAAVGCFFGPSLYWLLSSLEVVQVLLFFAVVRTFYQIEQSSNIPGYSEMEINKSSS